MEGQPHVGLLRFRHDGLQEVLGPLQLIGARVRPDTLAWRQVCDSPE